MVQEKYQAGTAEYFNGELDRLRRSELGEKEKKAIEEFLTDFQYNSKETPSFHRLYFHCNNLRSFALGMKSKFLEPSKKDVLEGLKIQKDRVSELERKISLGTFPASTEEVVDIREKIPKFLYEFYKDSGHGDFVEGLESVHGHFEDSNLIVKNGDTVEVSLIIPRIVKEYLTAPLHSKDTSKRKYYNESAIGIARGIKEITMEWGLEEYEKNKGKKRNSV